VNVAAAMAVAIKRFMNPTPLRFER
jgi:hypothetical protein